MFDVGPLAPASAIERPERRLPRERALERAAIVATGLLVRPALRSAAPLRIALPRIAAAERRIAQLGEAGFAAHVVDLRRRLCRSRERRAALPAAFATVREAARRTLDKRHFDVQLLGGLAMLRGRVAEMATGEGKTLTATLPAATFALAGAPVHVLTVNDYLAARDAAAMEPIYALLGLSVGCVTGGMDRAERRAQYARDIVHVTAKEVAFDWLRDGLALPPGATALGLHAARFAGLPEAGAPVLRGLHVAILDEADSVLLDEARTPLIISGGEPEAEFQAAAHEAALGIAAALREGADFRLLRAERRVEVTGAGEARVAALAAGRGGVWTARPFRHELARQALTALHLLRRDVEYLVRDGKVEIVDEATGRTMPDRRWESGLHQMVELKEGCSSSPPDDTLAATTFQRFFRRYHHLCGMTGTARDVGAELWATYRLPVTTIPSNRPSRRRHVGLHVSCDQATKWRVIAARLVALHEAGRPVLVGTRTIIASEAVAAELAARGLPFALLNARQDQAEATLVAEAGQAGRITIATNMAGRGTDILLGSGVLESGGLHVLATDLHDSRRVDRQLLGRAGRQGDPGTTEFVLALDDRLLTDNAPRVARLLRSLPEGALRARLALGLMRVVQRLVGRRHAEERRQLRKADEQEAESLAFIRG